MKILSKIGKDLFEYFLLLYPEEYIVSLCISEKNFNKFAIKNNINDFDFYLRSKLNTLDIKDSYACLTIAVYQSMIYVKKQVNYSNSYNPKLCKKLKMTIVDLEKWYSDYQEEIWSVKLKKLFKSWNRTLLLPDCKEGKDRYVQFPLFQFIINPEDVKCYNKTEFTFEEYSKRNFNEEDKKYYDKSKEYLYKDYYKYGKNSLNYMAKRIIYSFIVNDIKFIKPIRTKQSLIVKRIIIERLNNNHLLLLIENDEIRIKKNDGTDVELSSLFTHRLFYIFKFDHQNALWIQNTSRNIKDKEKYGVLIKDFSGSENNNFHNLIETIYPYNNHYFLEIKENKNSIKSMCNIFHLIYDLNLGFTFIGGLKTKNNEYYNFSLPIVLLNNKPTNLYINDMDIKISSNSYNLNSFKEYINEGENIIKTDLSQKHQIFIAKKQINIHLNKLGWVINDNDLSISYSYPYHIQGLQVSNNIPQVEMKIKNKNILFYATKPISRILNKNLKQQLTKGRTNGF